MIWSDKFPDLGAVRDRNCYTGIEIAMIATTVAATAFTAVSSIASGNAAAAQASANSAMLRRAAMLEERQAGIAYQRKLREGLILRGRTLAALTGAGVDVTQATPLDLLNEQTKESEFQAQQARFEHEQRAWQIRMGAISQEQAGARAESTGYARAFGAVLQGGARIAGMELLKPSAPTTPSAPDYGPGGPGYGGPTAPRPD